MHAPGGASGLDLDSEYDSSTPAKHRTYDSETPSLLAAKSDLDHLRSSDEELTQAHTTPSRRAPGGDCVIEETPNGSKVVHI